MRRAEHLGLAPRRLRRPDQLLRLLPSEPVDSGAARRRPKLRAIADQTQTKLPTPTPPPTGGQVTPEQEPGARAGPADALPADRERVGRYGDRASRCAWPTVARPRSNSAATPRRAWPGARPRDDVGPGGRPATATAPGPGVGAYDVAVHGAERLPAPAAGDAVTTVAAVEVHWRSPGRREHPSAAHVAHNGGQVAPGPRERHPRRRPPVDLAARPATEAGAATRSRTGHGWYDITGHGGR